jgi:predicted LPLAT superfamily acyltransferase
MIDRIDKIKKNDKIETRWRNKSIGSRFGHNFFYLMIKLGGRRVAYFFLYFIVFYYALFSPSVKDKTDPYLSKRFPDSGIMKKMYNRYMMILNLGKSLVDRAIIGIKGQKSMHISFNDPDHLVKVKSLNSGFIILMSHTGCWQGVMSALSELQKPVNLLMLMDNQDIDKHYFEHGNLKNKLKIINPEQFLGGTIEMINALKNDEILCIMGDRVFNNQDLCVDINFLGEKALFPFSAYKIASIVQKPVVILYSYKSGAKHYKLTIPEIIHVPPKLGKTKENYKPYVQKFVTSLELFIQEYPFQFFNFYDMWENKRRTKKN